MVDEVGHLGAVFSHPPDLKASLTPGPHCRRNCHVSNSVPYGSWLERKEIVFNCTTFGLPNS